MRWVKKTGSLKVDLLALRRALGNDVGWPSTPKGTGRPKANVGAMWKHFTTSIYQSGDLPVIAAREALQNSVDAIRAAAKARKIRTDAGRFSVTWTPSTRTLVFEDNGIGMDQETIEDKFLDLGISGKGAASGSGEAAGGFGVAKAVILGVSETFRWELHTRNNRAVAAGFDADIPIYEAPMLAGTRLTIYDIPSRFVLVRDPITFDEVELGERLRVMLAANDLPGIEIVLNGEKVPLLFSRRAGSKVAAGGDWGPGTTATAKAYRRTLGDESGAYYVRLNGLFQFRKPARNRNGLRTDVVIDLNSTTRPGASGYPINAARDQFQGNAFWTFSDLAAEVERENLTTGADRDYEIFDPEEDESGRDIGDATAEAFADKDFQKALAESEGGLRDFFAEQDRYQAKRTPAGSDAPPGSREGDEGPQRWVSATPAPDDAAGMIRSLLGQAERSPGQVVTAEVEKALERAEAGQTLGPADVAEIVHAVERAEEAALAGGGGLLGVASVNRVFDALDEIAETKPKRPQSPFGRLAGLLVSKNNYDRAKARRFRKNFATWIPYLTVWDATLRLIAAEARMRWRFKPGFVLDDEVWGLTKPSDTAGAIVYVHPDRLKLAATAHKKRPFGLAAFLHGLACHELTHVDGYGDHDEKFSAARDKLGYATGHLLPAIAVLAATVLKLDTPKSEKNRIAELERELADAKRGSSGTAQAAEVARLRRELEAARKALAAAQTASAEVGREAEIQCPTCNTSALRKKAEQRVAKIFARLRERPPEGLSTEQIDDYVKRRGAVVVEKVFEALAAREKRG